MLTQYEKDIILQCAKKYNVSAVFLFGSSLGKGSELLFCNALKNTTSRLFFYLVHQLEKVVSLMTLTLE